MTPVRLADAAFSDRWRLNVNERPGCRDCAVRHRVFCGGVPEDHVDDLEADHEMLQVAEGHMLYLEGEAAEAAYIVKGGALKLYKLLPDGRRQITEFALPGDWVGLKQNGRYVHSLQAIVPSTLCEFSCAHMTSLSARFAGVEAARQQQWQHALAAAQEQILMLGRMNPIEKLSSFLVNLHHRREVAGLHGNPIYLPMSRSDIADYLGVTIETVSRSMSRLRSCGLIEPLDRTRIQVIDLAMLRRQAGQ